MNSDPADESVESVRVAGLGGRSGVIGASSSFGGRVRGEGG